VRTEANLEYAEGGAMESVKRAWHWLTTTRYTRSLEAEVERLRGDNIALRASVFGLVGKPGQTYAAYLAQQLQPRKANGETKTPEPARRHVNWAEIRKKLEARDVQQAAKETARAE
jgi:hypothetical protein